MIARRTEYGMQRGLKLTGSNTKTLAGARRRYRVSPSSHTSKTASTTRYAPPRFTPQRHKAGTRAGGIAKIRDKMLARIMCPTSAVRWS